MTLHTQLNWNQGSFFRILDSVAITLPQVGEVFAFSLLTKEQGAQVTNCCTFREQACISGE
jgi:hypothetical protein